jgi:hypothetical protein
VRWKTHAGGPLSEPDECGRPYSGFITQLTGITNAMLLPRTVAAQVMRGRLVWAVRCQ